MINDCYELHTIRVICCMQQIYGPHLLLHFHNSVLFSCPFKSYLIFVMYLITYSWSSPSIYYLLAQFF